MGDTLADAVAIVTGGGAGIGEATCLRLAEDGAAVGVLDRDGEAAEATASAIRDQGDSQALALTVDVADEAAITAAVETVVDRFDRVDVLVNNAAIRVEPRALTEVDRESWDRILGVNLTGPANCIKHVVPHMPEGGSIVNVASNGASVGRPKWSQYDATKGALVSLTRDAACDHAPDGIRVNAVSPGWVITDFHLPDDEDEAHEFIEAKTTPHDDGPGILKRAATPREIANVICFLASEEASFVTGTNLAVDGGLAAVGKGLDWDDAR